MPLHSAAACCCFCYCCFFLLTVCKEELFQFAVRRSNGVAHIEVRFGCLKRGPCACEELGADCQYSAVERMERTRRVARGRGVSEGRCCIHRGREIRFDVGRSSRQTHIEGVHGDEGREASADAVGGAADTAAAAAEGEQTEQEQTEGAHTTCDVRMVHTCGAGHLRCLVCVCVQMRAVRREAMRGESGCGSALLSLLCTAALPLLYLSLYLCSQSPLVPRGEKEGKGRGEERRGGEGRQTKGKEGKGDGKHGE